jgi:hypothetical protein
VVRRVKRLSLGQAAKGEAGWYRERQWRGWEAEVLAGYHKGVASAPQMVTGAERDRSQHNDRSMLRNEGQRPRYQQTPIHMGCSWWCESSSKAWRFSRKQKAMDTSPTARPTGWNSKGQKMAPSSEQEGLLHPKGRPVPFTIPERNIKIST